MMYFRVEFIFFNFSTIIQQAVLFYCGFAFLNVLSLDGFTVKIKPVSFVNTLILISVIIQALEDFTKT